MFSYWRVLSPTHPVSDALPDGVSLRELLTIEHAKQLGEVWRNIFNTF